MFNILSDVWAIKKKKKKQQTKFSIRTDRKLDLVKNIKYVEIAILRGKKLQHVFFYFKLELCDSFIG